MEIKMKELKIRSAIKSIIWRLIGILILGGVTFFYTRKWVTTSLITFIHHGVFLFVFYAHERIWLKCKLTGLKRKIIKCLTYETLLGNLILGTITYCITGSWKQMTAITLTYIGIKHLIYIFNEIVWEKIKTGKVT